MNLFDPRTFSTDWEIMVVDRLERCVGEEKLMAFAGLLHRELGIPVKIDWRTLEFAMGINSSLDELWRHVQTVTDRASDLLSEYDLDLYPAGAHPVEAMYNASHIHAGTIHDESAAINLSNRLLHYAPAFGALAANSPVAAGRRGEFKSYRVRYQAHGCTRAGIPRDPRTAQEFWGADAGPKLASTPTLEVRITDCVSSRRLLAELATFVAAYLHHAGTGEELEPITPERYRDSLTNRWAAARHGLQATFVWQGGARPVVEILHEMLDECHETLAVLGARRGDLQVIEAMLGKRVCQADFVSGLAGRYSDPYCLASAHAKLVRHWTVFEEYLERVAALDPLPVAGDEAITAAHLDVIGEGTPFHRSREAMSYPPAVADEIVERLVEQGAIRREVSANRGTLLSRVE